MGKAGRKTEISIQNVLYCLMVIWHHCLSEAVTCLEPGSWAYPLALIPWQMAFAAVYGFVFLSGVKLFLPGHEQESLGQFYLRRVKTVLIPYLLATAVYLLLRVLYAEPMTGAEVLSCFLLGNGATHLYFVVIIVQFYLLMPLWRRLVDRVHPGICLGAALFLSLSFQQCLDLLWPTKGMLSGAFAYYQDRFFVTYLPFWLLGCYAGANYERFLALLDRNRRAIGVCFGLFTLMDQWCTWLGYARGAYIPMIGVIGDAYLVFAILACYVLGQRLSGGRLANSSLPGRVDRASYLIYLSHMLVLLACNWLMNRLGLSHIGLRLAVRLAVVLGVTIPGCLLWQRVSKGVKGAWKSRES